MFRANAPAIREQDDIVFMGAYSTASQSSTAVLYGAAGRIEAAVKSVGYCALHGVFPSHSHTCVATTAIGSAPTRIALFPRNGPIAQPTFTFQSSEPLIDHCGDRFSVGFVGALGKLSTGEQWNAASAFGGLETVNSPIVDGDVALTMGAESVLDHHSIWAWDVNRQSRRVLTASQPFIQDVRSSGGSIAWVEAPSNNVSDGQLMTGQYSFAGGVSGIRSVHAVAGAVVSRARYAMGGGYYALMSMKSLDWSDGSSVHVYRLSDGRHWQVPEPPAFYDPSKKIRATTLLYLDDQEIVYAGSADPSGWETEVVRQRLDALGAGD